MPKHWLTKSEPDKYSWDEFVKDGSTYWDGVRNYQARNNLQAMKKGDLILYYHSNVGKEVVGIARVTGEAYPHSPHPVAGHGREADRAPSVRQGIDDRLCRAEVSPDASTGHAIPRFPPRNNE